MEDNLKNTGEAQRVERRSLRHLCGLCVSAVNSTLHRTPPSYTDVYIGSVLIFAIVLGVKGRIAFA